MKPMPIRVRLEFLTPDQRAQVITWANHVAPVFAHELAREQRQQIVVRERTTRKAAM